MRKRALLVCVSLVLAFAVFGCSKPAPDVSGGGGVRAREGLHAAVIRVFGSAAISTLDTRTIAGREPVAFMEISADSTPTAAGVFGVLSAMSEEYAGQGRWMGLSVVLPEQANGVRSTFYLHYNPTGSTIPTLGGSTIPLSPGAVLVDKGRREGSGTLYLPSDMNLVLSSKATTENVVQAAEGSGLLAERLREYVGLE